MSVDWKAFVSQLGHYESFVLTSHIRPDCDALGSELAMAEVLRAAGKKVRIINAHRTPPALEFIDPAGTIEVLGDDVQAEQISADCIMILDTSAWAQLGDMGDVIRRSRTTRWCWTTTSVKMIWAQSCTRTTPPRRPAISSSRPPMRSVYR